MYVQKTIFELPVNPNDIVFTPDRISKSIIDFLQPNGFCLDPCKGDGAFYRHFPTSDKDWCEIKEGRDFFDYTNKVNWIIGNPPYSIFEKFLEKAFEIADNVAYLVPTNKIFQRQLIMNRINKWGGGKKRADFRIGTIARFSIRVLGGPFPFSKTLSRDHKNGPRDA